MLKTTSDDFSDRLCDIHQQFKIVLSNYYVILSSMPTPDYTKDNTNKDNTNKHRANLKNSYNILKNVTSKLFDLSHEINNTIKNNNTNIQNLDKIIDNLKKNVINKNKMLKKIEGSSKGAIPRKQYLKEIMQHDYYIDAFYFCAMVGGSYFLYKLYYTNSINK